MHGMEPSYSMYSLSLKLQTQLPKFSRDMGQGYCWSVTMLTVMMQFF